MSQVFDSPPFGDQRGAINALLVCSSSARSRLFTGLQDAGDFAKPTPSLGLMALPGGRSFPDRRESLASTR